MYKSAVLLCVVLVLIADPGACADKTSISGLSSISNLFDTVVERVYGMFQRKPLTAREMIEASIKLWDETAKKVHLKNTCQVTTAEHCRETKRKVVAKKRIYGKAICVCC